MDHSWATMFVDARPTPDKRTRPLAKDRLNSSIGIANPDCVVYLAYAGFGVDSMRNASAFPTPQCAARNDRPGAVLLAVERVTGRSLPGGVEVMEFGLYLFSTDEETVQKAVEAGVDGIVIDWENVGKPERQAGADTQINFDSPEDLARVRRCTNARVLCRINGFCQATVDEVARAIDCGADELLLPMVRKADEVRATLDLVSERVDLGILVETSEAIEGLDELVRLPIRRVYVGLNDLAIDRGLRNIFESVADGTVESVRESCHLPFGFAGLTLPDRGSPIPCRLLINEMARLRCDFSFLRRSFYADMQRTTIAAAIPAIREAMAVAMDEPPKSLMRSRSELLDHIKGWSSP